METATATSEEKSPKQTIGMSFQSLPHHLESLASEMLEKEMLTINCSDNDDDRSEDSRSPGGGPMRSRDRKRCLSPNSREDLRLKINLRERQRMHDLNVSFIFCLQHRQYNS